MPTRMAKTAIHVTPRQIELLRAIACFHTSRGYSPTIGELACELGVSRSTAFEHISKLRKKRLLFAPRGRARSLTLSSRALELLDRINSGDSAGRDRSLQGIPLVGRVAAGVPIEAVEEKQSLSLSSHFGSSDALFALQVCGESMVEEDIRDGDYVICRHAPTARNGQLVIAVLDNENATLKRFYKEKKHVRLEPANEAYEAICSADCRIEAVVIGLVRRFGY